MPVAAVLRNRRVLRHPADAKSPWKSTTKVLRAITNKQIRETRKHTWEPTETGLSNDGTGTSTHKL
jgi:hypothetical protein